MYKHMNNDELIKEIRNRFSELPSVEEVKSSMDDEGYPYALSDCSEFADFYLIDIPEKQLEQLDFLQHEKELLNYLLMFEDSFFFIGEVMSEGLVTTFFNLTGNELKRRKKNLKRSADTLYKSFEILYTHLRENIEFSDDTSVTMLAFKSNKSEQETNDVNKIFKDFKNKINEDLFEQHESAINDLLEDIYHYLIDKYEVEYTNYLKG